MLKQISNIKNILWGWIEKELITVLAVCLLMLGIWGTKAATDTTNLSFIILDVGTITVTAPNGGEDWQVDSSQHITWTSTGSIASIKIELQRTVGGDWETLIASTVNDGDYPWPVTTPATTTAIVRVSSVTVPAITDSSDAVFTISAVPETPGGPGGYLPTYPMIDSISPMNFYHDDATELIIRGLGFKDYAWVILNQVIFPVQKPHSQNLMTMDLLSNTLNVGTYRLCVYNSFWEYDCYRHLITVTDKTKIIPPTTGGTVETYEATLVNQFSLKPGDGIPLQTEQKITGQSPDVTLKVGDEAVLWVEFKNTGTATWYQDGSNPVRLGTDNKRDRRSGFYHNSWIKNNRPALVNKVVKPGEIGRFEFVIKAPWIAKTYTEYFKPVAEYKAWMSGRSQVQWIITVQKKTLKELFTKPKTVQPLVPPVVSSPAPIAPSTGGKVETPFQPGTTLFFSDRVEQIYQSAIKLFNNFLTKFRK
ncbi:MAG: hypothetical protein V1807_01240 [Patescibacteria group bacterium]